MSLAQDVYQQLASQLGYTDANLSRGVRSAPPPMSGGGQPYPGQPMPAPQPQEQVIILR